MAKTQTFSKQCSKVGSFGYAGNFKLYVVLTDRDGNPSTNKSFVDYHAYCQASGSGSISANHDLYFSINGQEKRNERVKVNVSSPDAYIFIASGTIEVPHNDNGTKTISFSAAIEGVTYGVEASFGDSFTLETIPRYFSKDPTIELTSKTETSLTFKWTTSEACSQVQYKINTGNWVNVETDINKTSGSFTISGLSANTNYTIYGDFKRKDSGLWAKNKPSQTVVTYNYPYCTEAPNFTIGDNVTIKLYNPLNRTVQIQMWSFSGSQFVSDLITISGTSYTGFGNVANRLYASIPNDSSSEYNIDVHYNGNKAPSNKGNRYSIKGTETPTFNNFEFSAENTYNLTGNYQTIIKGYSNVKVTISTANKAIANNYATMVEYIMSMEGSEPVKQNYSSSSAVNLQINNVKSNIITVYAKDSRQNSTSKSITASNYINYSPIKINTISLIRTDSVKPETTLKFSGYIWDGNFGKVTNSIQSCSYRYRKTGTSSWTTGATTITPTKSGTSFSFSGKIQGDLGANGFDIDNSYDVQVLIADRLSNNNSLPASFVLGPGTPAMAIYKNNVAIGQRYDTSDPSKLQVNGNSKFKGNIDSSGYMNLDGYVNGKSGFISKVDSGSVNTPIGNSKLIIKRAYAADSPNNGVVLEYGNSTNWIGQLFFADNSYDGVWYSGWSNGVRDSWHKLADVPVTLYDNTSGTNGTITLSENVANFSYIEIHYCDNNNNNYKSVKVFEPTNKEISLDIAEGYIDNNLVRTGFRTRRVKIVGNQLTTVSSNYSYLVFNEVGDVHHTHENFIKITRVIGYR